MQWRDRWTRNPKGKALVGWQTYYRLFLEDVPGRPLIDHRGPYLGGEARQTELIDALTAGRRAILVAADPGCGKSRFALELARRLGRTQRSWQVRFVRHDEPGLEEELRALPTSGRRVLVVDDAHECPGLIGRLSALCAVPGSVQTQLVCLTRPAGRTALIEALACHLPVTEPLQLELGRPDPKAIRELIDARVPQLSPHHRDVIRRYVADSYFATVLLCSSVARQKKLPQTLSSRNLRDYVVRQPLAQAVADLCPPEKALRALAVYAVGAPVSDGDAAIRSSAAAHAALATADIEALELRVLEAGLFERDGRGGIRPLPALVGDLIVEEACLDEQGRPTSCGHSLIRALLEERRYERVIDRFGDLTRLLAKPERVDFLSELLLERANGLSPQHGSQTAGLLDGCVRLAARQPQVVVRLFEALTVKGVLRAVPPPQELSREDNPEVRALRLLSAAGEADSALVPRALEYARQLLAVARADASGQRALLDTLAWSCQLAVARPLTHARAVLTVLKSWSEDSGPASAELAASLLRGFLRLQMCTHRWEQQGPTLVSIAIDPADDICQMRDYALDILVRCANHNSPAVAYAAASCLAHWAEGHCDMTAERRQRWESQLTREMERLTATFGKLGAETVHLPVRAAVERQGWRWWLEGAEPFVRRGGSRLLEPLPSADTYSLWKALHGGSLPVFPPPRDESLEPPGRRESLLPLLEPSAARAADLARELLDRLDTQCRDAAAWSALLASVVSAEPRQPLHAAAHVYLAAFVARHPDEAWSLISEEAAASSLGVVLPALLTELRGRDTPRWHQLLRSASPGTRLFTLALGALCATGGLDPVEQAMVSRGLELEDPRIVHLAARTLLSAAHPALPAGLGAVMGVLPRLATDERLWELTLDAFAGWGAHLLTLPAGEEPDSAIRTASGELLQLLRTAGTSLSWRAAPHSRRLADVLAIFAVAVPLTLKSWMRQDAMPAAEDGECDAVLSAARLREVVRILSTSSAAPFWQRQFLEWVTEEPDLARIGARGLAGIGGLGDPGIALLVRRIARHSTESSRDALEVLLADCIGSPRFVADALSLLRELAGAEEAYGLLEQALLAAVMHGGAGAGPIEGRAVALETLDQAERDPELPPSVRQTVGRARRALQGGIEEDLLRGTAG